MFEVWKPVLDYAGLYEVSNFGRVKSLARTVMREPGGKYRSPVMNFREKILKPGKYNRYGHLLVVLTKDKKRRSRPVHTLVLEAFTGRRPKGLEIAHNDGDPQNNHLSNLRWCTRRENARDAMKHGTCRKGSQIHFAKLHESDIPVIMQMLGDGATCAGIARQYDVTASAISLIKHGRSWRHVTGL